jgi:hypothetical protein
LRTEAKWETPIDIITERVKSAKCDLHPGDTARGVVGSWTYGDNLVAFNRLTAQGMSLEEAAAQTWTGAQSVKNGFTRVEVIAKGAPGAYSRVLAKFTR